MIPPARPAVAVIGGGIAGLAAAWELASGAAGHNCPEVHVFEAGDGLGGKLRSRRFADRTVDLAADAFLARRPEATDLCTELGIDDRLVPVGASGAAVFARGRLRPMPEGLNLGIPTRWWPLLRSGIVSPVEALEVARDLLGLHRGGEGVDGDRSVGDIVTSRLGRPITERLADPLIGGINAGDVDLLSAAATFPPLMTAARQSGSLMRRLGQTRAPATTTGASIPPLFWSLSSSTASLVDLLAEALGRRGVSFHLQTPVEGLDYTPPGRSGGGRWRVTTPFRTREDRATGHPEELDGIVLALPARPAGSLLSSLAPEAAALLDAIEYASVTVVTLSLMEGAITTPIKGTGFLVPRTSTVAGRPALTTGCTYLSRKWPHLARPNNELVRVSLGRFGDLRHADLNDDEIVAAAADELAQLIGLRGTPRASMVTRWSDAFPQYRVGHLDRVDSIGAHLGGLPGLALAGAAYRGVGIPACIGSGRAAARQVLDSLATTG
jgi:oxygen-dependent protoporphyrinogen oxidase